MSRNEIGLREARQQLGDLVTDAQYGHTTIITRNGRPAAMLVPYAEEPAMTNFMMAYRGPDGRPAFQSVSDRHRDEPGTIPASEVAGLDDDQAEALTAAAERYRKSLAKGVKARQRKIYGKSPAPAPSGPAPYFGWEITESGDQINVWFRDVGPDGEDVWVPHSSLVRKWDPDSNDEVVIRVLVDKELVRAAIARGESMPLVRARPFPAQPGDLQFTAVPWQE